MFSHNINARDLAFEYEEYDFMAHHKHVTKDESCYREKFTPRENMNEEEGGGVMHPPVTLKKLDEMVLRSHASLFPKIFNSLITKLEKLDMQIFKRPLIDKIGTVKSIKLLNFDLSGFDSREMYEYLGHEDH